MQMHVIPGFTSQQRKIVVDFVTPVPQAEFIKKLSITELPDVGQGRARLPEHPITAALLSKPSLPLLPRGVSSMCPGAIAFLKPG